MIMSQLSSNDKSSYECIVKCPRFPKQLKLRLWPYEKTLRDLSIDVKYLACMGG